MCLIFGVLRKDILGITFPGRKCVDDCFLQRTILEHRVGMERQTDRGLLCTGIHVLFIKIEYILRRFRQIACVVYRDPVALLTSLPA